MDRYLLPVIANMLRPPRPPHAPLGSDGAWFGEYPDQHLHYLERPYLDQFKDFNAPVLQYSVKTSGIPISEIRQKYSQPILGGVDEIDYRKLTTEEIRSQWQDARSQAGAKYVAAPGCSIPNNSTSDELARFPKSLGI